MYRAETAPFGESGGAVQLEMVGNRGVNGGEFLNNSHALETKHRPI